MIIKIKDAQGKEMEFATMYPVRVIHQPNCDEIICEEWILTSSTLDWWGDMNKN